jgi:predicted AAA+ superfamily ATPase
MLKRPYYIDSLNRAFGRSPIVALLGPRQCGKTTLARMLMQDNEATYFDLESVPDQRRLENPEFVLGDLEGLVILDEIQLNPGLFSVLRVLVDRPGNKAQYLILGSASPDITKNVSETLAGRVEFIELSGFDLLEVGMENWEDLWIRGGFPRAYLAASKQDSLVWREGFIRTFLERDIPQLGINIPSIAMRRFWTMLAHFHGQTWNASQLGRSMGLSDKTVRSYLDILTGTYMVRQLQPWIANLGKRQVKSPKIYFRDSGLLHSLLEITDAHNLLGNPKAGASWEGFAIEQVLQIVRPNQAYFWATHSGAEIDLLFSAKGKNYGVEVKLNEAPKITASMHTALSELGLEHLWIIYPGKEAYSAFEKISVFPLSQIDQLPITRS